MGVTGIGSNNISDAYITSATEKEKTTAANATQKTEEVTSDKNTTTTENSNTAAVYDKSKLSADDRKAIVSQLKADQEKRQSQLADLVYSMMSKQTTTFGQANNMWQFLAKGDFTVDAATRKKAQEDISEDGYWGVKQTSDRIVQFATALAGNDSKQLEKMRDAFLKGYEKAEKTWGGKLPDISKKTYDAVLEKFDKLMKPSTESSTSTNKQPSNTTTDKVTTTEDGTVVAK